MDFEAQDDGVVAKILIPAGQGEDCTYPVGPIAVLGLTSALTKLGSGRRNPHHGYGGRHSRRCRFFEFLGP